MSHTFSVSSELFFEALGGGRTLQSGLCRFVIRFSVSKSGLRGGRSPLYFSLGTGCPFPLYCVGSFGGFTLAVVDPGLCSAIQSLRSMTGAGPAVFSVLYAFCARLQSKSGRQHTTACPHAPHYHQMASSHPGISRCPIDRTVFRPLDVVARQYLTHEHKMAKIEC
jgi:hypothetical protein